MATRKERTPGAHSEVLLDLGPALKIVQWTLLPGACTPRFRHHCPYVLFPLTSGDMKRVVRQNGKQIERRQKLVPGRPYLRKVGKSGLEQSFCNEGDGPVTFAKMIFCPHCKEWDDLIKRVAK